MFLNLFIQQKLKSLIHKRQQRINNNKNLYEFSQRFRYIICFRRCKHTAIEMRYEIHKTD